MARKFASKTARRFTTEDLHDAGASEAFISMYLSTAGDRRHSIREELDSGYGGEVLERGGDPSNAGGGFFAKVWNGDLFDAFLHADGSNTPLMLEVFGPEKIRRQGVDEAGYGLDYATRMVNDKATRHGYDEL